MELDTSSGYWGKGNGGEEGKDPVRRLMKGRVTKEVVGRSGDKIGKDGDEVGREMKIR